MIKNFDRISSKSFNEYSLKEDLKEVNLFFGINGSGKSALSDWLYNYNPEVTKKFDTIFVNDNLKTKGSLEGVKLTVGAQVIEREELINTIEQANKSIIAVNDELEKNEYEDYDELYSIIDETLKQTKEQFKSTRVNHKRNSKQNPIEAIERWKNDSLIDIEVRDDISGEEIERELHRLPGIISSIKELSNWLTEDYETHIEMLFNKKINKLDNEMNSKLLDWLSIGLNVHSMHEETEKCQFCNQIFEVTEVKDRITRQINTEYKETLDYINNFIKYLKNTQNQLLRLPDVISKEEKENIEEIINILTETAENKKLDTEELFEISDELKKLKDFDEHLFVYRMEQQEKLESYNTLNNKIESVIKKIVGETLMKNQEVKNLIEKNIRYKNSINLNNTAISENNDKLREWHNENSDLEPFKNLVNKHLLKLGLDFYLEISKKGKSYTVKHRNTELDIMIEHLSEGELRLLGFLYYYHSSFSEINDISTKVRTELKTFVIDDPITSLDNNNRYYLTNMINEYIKELVGHTKQGEIQVFILTHSSIDFHNLSYGFNKKRMRKWNIYKNMDGESEIRLLSNKESSNYSDYYKSVLLELIDFAVISKNKLTGKRNFLSYGNKGRFILESHARTHYNIENTTSSNLPEIMECYNIPDEYKQLTKIMLDTLNSLSHGVSISDDFFSSISAMEVQASIISLINILYLKDPQHIDSIGMGAPKYSDFKRDKLKASLK